MKRVNQRLIFSVLLISGLIMAGIASAQIQNPIHAQDFETILIVLGVQAAKLITALAGLMVIVAGILYVISAGNPSRVQAANTALFYAFMGILVGLAADSISSFIQGASGGNNPTAIITAIAGQIGKVLTALGGVMVLVAGIFYVTSFGNPKRMEAAKSTLIYAVIGIMIGLATSAIVSFVTGLVK